MDGMLEDRRVNKDCDPLTLLLLHRGDLQIRSQIFALSSNLFCNLNELVLHGQLLLIETHPHCRLPNMLPVPCILERIPEDS
jgi:hypothetical protein